ncbi:MAG: alpha-beta hydrolase superfamily lysophospholipase [Candidatus Azotimanducaceae bacterium]|jgi:alpha-beta hydrolase superfamily lysophospholipase
MKAESHRIVNLNIVSRILRCASDQFRRHAVASATGANVIIMGLVVALATGCSNHIAGDGLQLEHFEFESGGDKLSGVLARPIATEHLGVVVFVHGDGPVTADYDGGYRSIWAALARAGYASLSWDKPGVGRSSGNWLSQSMADRADEVGHAIDAIVREGLVDSQHVALFGASQAGWVLPLVAAQHPPEFVIALSPAINWLSQSRFQTDLSLDTRNASLEVRAQVQAYRYLRLALLQRGAPYVEYQRWQERLPSDVRPYFDEMSADRYQFVALNYLADATDALSHLKGIPMLLMQGGKDVLVDIDETKITYKNILGDCLHQRRYANADHSLIRAELSECKSCLLVTAITNPANLFPERMSTDIEDFVRSRQCANPQRN